MAGNSKAEEQIRKKLALADEIDETIIGLCGDIQKSDFVPGERAETVKALAALVEARAHLRSY